ncbi:HNH endonuclease [Achromobacter deleyi]|uniref:HNH endonuclease n=1 Tax=Achromobacter deleyi TaxID=1353891 RepID=UPI00158235A9|nr:HNH endonuclease [Achromobacter deleyi]
MKRLTGLMARLSPGEPGACWDSGYSANTKGYPCCRLNGKQVMVHRQVLIEVTGAVGRVARHKCDNKRCWNPAHLEWGSVQDNAHDHLKRGGVIVKLSADDVKEIRALLGRMPRKEIAIQFNVHRSSIDQIASGLAWSAV